MAALKLTDKQSKFLETFCDCVEDGVEEGEARRLAKEAAGYAQSTTFHHIMSDEMIDAMLHYANRRLALGIPKAIGKLNSVMDDPTQEGVSHILNAVASWLDRGGVTKKESKEITVKAPTGLVYLPPKAPLDEPIE